MHMVNWRQQDSTVRPVLVKSDKKPSHQLRATSIFPQYFSVGRIKEVYGSNFASIIETQLSYTSLSETQMQCLASRIQ